MVGRKSDAYERSHARRTSVRNSVPCSKVVESVLNGLYKTYKALHWLPSQRMNETRKCPVLNLVKDQHFKLKVLFAFLADRTNGRAYATVLRLSVRPSVRRPSVTLCIVAKRCVLEQKLPFPILAVL